MYQCGRCSKHLASRQSLWNHKQRCSAVVGEKRPLDNKFLTIPPKGYAHLADHDEVSPTVEKRNVYAFYKSNPKVQAFVNDIINSVPKSAVTQNLDDLPTVADDVFQMHKNVNGKPLRP